MGANANMFCFQHLEVRVCITFETERILLIFIPQLIYHLFRYRLGGCTGEYNGPQNLDSVISYTWEIKGGGPSGTNAKEVSAFI